MTSLLRKPLPGTMNQAQFNAWKAKTGRPHATWQGYQGWVGTKRKQRAATQASPVYQTQQATSKWLANMLTPQQQLQMATRVAGQSIAAQQAENRRATKAAQVQAQNQATRAQGYALALGNLTKNIPEQLRANYQQAADRLRAYGTGLTGALGEAYNKESADTAARMAATGADLSTLTGGALPNQYDPGAIRNTLQMTGVVTPGATLEAQAANAYGYGNALRQASIAKVGQIAQDYLQKKVDYQRDLADKQRALFATRPDLVNRALQNIQSNQTQNMATLVSALTLQNTMGKTAFDILNQGTKTKSAVKQAGQKGARDWSKVTGIYTDDTGNPVLKNGQPQLLSGYWWSSGKVGVGNPAKYNTSRSKTNADGTKLIKLTPQEGGPTPPKPGQPKPKPGAWTPTKIASYVAKQSGTIRSVVMQPPYIKHQSAIEKKYGQPHPLLSYQDAYSRLMAYFLPRFRNRPDVIRAVQDTLSTAGYTAPAAPTTTPAPTRGSHGAPP